MTFTRTTFIYIYAVPFLNVIFGDIRDPFFLFISRQITGTSMYFEENVHHSTRHSRFEHQMLLW